MIYLKHLGAGFVMGLLGIPVFGSTYGPLFGWEKLPPFADQIKYWLIGSVIVGFIYATYKSRSLT
jgi:hypothetical protein